MEKKSWCRGCGTATPAADSNVGPAKGKKASSLSVGATVKSTGAFTISAIGKSAFKGAKAKSVTLGKNIKKIPASY